MPLSFGCLAISRRDGTSVAHAIDQIDFTPYVKPAVSVDPSRNAALAQLASADQCNQNVDGVPATSGPAVLRQLPAATAAGRAAVDRMSQSVHEARNQIFDDDQRRQKKSKRQPDACPNGSAAAASASASVLSTSAVSSRSHHHQLHHHHQHHQHTTSAPRTPQLAFAMDPSYGVLWSLDGQTGVLRCYNVTVSDSPDTEPEAGDEDFTHRVAEPSTSYVRTILSPELALPSTCVQTANGPIITPTTVSRAQASLNMLACLDILTYAGADAIPGCFESDAETARTACDTADAVHVGPEAYQLVSRFENFGGGWGYSGHSVEAIKFSADADIVVYGFAMFGGRGEYTCKLRLYDLGMEGMCPVGGPTHYDEDVAVLLCETDDIPYECPARSKYNIMLPRPVAAAAGQWFLVWARISGPSSDCGSAGQVAVTTEDQIVFTFGTSKKANNGTDVNSGQIPSILYRVQTPDVRATQAGAGCSCAGGAVPVEPDPVCAVTRLFASGVSRECFVSLVRLLSWSWRSFKVTLAELGAAGSTGKDRTRAAQTRVSLKRLVYICRACLRLLRKYCNEIYPSDGGRSTAAPARDDDSGTAIGETQIYVLNQGPSTSKSATSGKFLMGSSMDATTPTAERLAARKCNTENLQLAECIGDVRALLIQILCDEVPPTADGGGLDEQAHATAQRIFDECHTTFLACFSVFYPTATLKWNSLCDLLAQDDATKQTGCVSAMPTRLLSAIVGGLCSPRVQLRHTFQLGLYREHASTATMMLAAAAGGAGPAKSIVSPSDNSGLPMLTSMELHQYPVLVEQMIYRTQQEKYFRSAAGWTFKDVLVRLLEIIAQPVRTRIENICNRGSLYTSGTSGQLLPFDWSHNQRLIDNCCGLLARVLAEYVYESCASASGSMVVDNEAAAAAAAMAGGDAASAPLAPISGGFASRMHTCATRFARVDYSRTWNTGNFGPDAIGFTVSRPGISVAGAMLYSGSGSYEYQLELLYDTADEHAHAGVGVIGAVGGAVGAGAAGGGGAGGGTGGSVGAAPGCGAYSKWETLETVTGSYTQDDVLADITPIKFDRPVPVRENVRYALRWCAHGARTVSGDAGMTASRGPCGVTFNFQPCDLSFNGTTTARGQIPSVLYYSAPVRVDAGSSGGGRGAGAGEQQARDAALQIAGDIGRKCAELLVLARNALAGGGGGGGGATAMTGAGGQLSGAAAAAATGAGGHRGGSESSPSEKSANSSILACCSSNSEQNISPIEEHFDIGFSAVAVGGICVRRVEGPPSVSGGMVGVESAATATAMAPATTSSNISSARDHFSKRIESFSKGIMETLKFGDKRQSSNPFEFEIEIGATEIQEKEQLEQRPMQVPMQQQQQRGGVVSNGNAGDSDQLADASERMQQQQRCAAQRRASSCSEDDTDGEQTCAETLKLFESRSASIFHTLLPLVFAHIGALAGHDPKVRLNNQH